MLDIKKGNNSANNVSGVTCFNLCKMAGHALHCTKFPEIMQTVSKLTSGHNFYIEITKGNNSAKNVGWNKCC